MVKLPIGNFPERGARLLPRSHLSHSPDARAETVRGQAGLRLPPLGERVGVRESPRKQFKPMKPRVRSERPPPRVGESALRTGPLPNKLAALRVAAYDRRMNRRNFLKSSAAAGFAIATTPTFAADFADMKKRVGLIGTGWYGKVDL